MITILICAALWWLAGWKIALAVLALALAVEAWYHVRKARIARRASESAKTTELLLAMRELAFYDLSRSDERLASAVRELRSARKETTNAR